MTVRPVLFNPRVCILVVMTLLGAVVLGWEMPHSPTIAVLSSLLPIAVILVLKPFLAIPLGLSALFLLPYGVFRLSSFPIFRSPVQVIILASAVGVALKFMHERKSLPGTPVYGGLGAYLLVMFGYTIIGHGPDMLMWLYRLAFGLWLFVFILVLVETPCQARITLIAMWGAFLAQALVATILNLYFIIVRGFDYRLLRLRREDFSQLVLPVTPLGFLIKGAPGMAMVAAMLGIVSLSLCLFASSERLRKLAGLSAVLLAIYLVTASWVIPMTAFLLGVPIVCVTGWRQGRLSRRQLTWLAAGVIMGLVLASRTVSGQYMWLRFRGDVLDPLLYGAHPVSMRWDSYSASITLFRMSPITGWGYYDSGFFWGTLAGPDHSTWLDMGYRFGVLGLIPYAAVILLIAREYLRLFHSQLSTDEQAMAIGLVAAFVVWNYMALFDPAAGVVEVDIYFWGFAGLAITWNHWLKTRPGQPLWS